MKIEFIMLLYHNNHHMNHHNRMHFTTQSKTNEHILKEKIRELCCKGDLEELKILIQKYCILQKIDYTPNDIKFDIMSTVCEIPKGSVKIVEYIYNLYQIDVNAYIEFCKKVTIESLAEHGINIFAHMYKFPKTNDALKPRYLVDVCYVNNIDILKFLVKKGADINQWLNHQESPLIASCHNSCIDCLLFLLEQNVDITDLDEYGRTVLHWVNNNVLAIILEWYEN